MMSHFIKTALVALLFQGNVYAKQQTRNITSQSEGNIVCITIPKAGSHLLVKCLNLFKIDGITLDYSKMQGKSPLKNLKDPLPQYFVDRIENGKKTPQRLYWYGHQHHTPEFEQYLVNNAYASFFLIRDPRDQLVSVVMSKKKRGALKNTSVQDALLDVIIGRKKKGDYPPNVYRVMLDILWEQGSYNFYELYMPWMKAKKFYTVKFENLIGPQGGGSKEAQLQEIKNISLHLGLKSSDEQIAQIAHDLFGGTVTFRKGETGSWKEHFTPEIKAAFKKTKAAQLLITLGYEKDMNW